MEGKVKITIIISTSDIENTIHDAQSYSLLEDWINRGEATEVIDSVEVEEVKE